MPLQATSGAASYDAFGGGVAAVPNYIEDVFSTYLYTGNGSTQTITNGIDLAGEGGMVWIKCRSTAYAHRVNDTVRGASKFLATNSTAAEDTNASVLTAFTSSGFSVGASTAVNENAATYASWTFRKQPKFFDVVTYTGNGVAGRAISHNLGSTPGFIAVKKTSNTGDWLCYHQARPAKYFYLNATAAEGDDSSGVVWGNGTTAVAPTSTNFTVNALTAFPSADINKSGETYVAYIFAHNAGGFGLTGTDNVISCGSYTGTGSSVTVDLGYEPQWILTRNVTDADDWFLFDNMRGIATGGTDAFLRPNLSNAENTASDVLDLTATGFKTVAAARHTNGKTYIYIAIRRGPMKVPTSGTSVFDADAYTGNGATNRLIDSGFTDDWFFFKNRALVNDCFSFDRLRGDGNYLAFDTTGAESGYGTDWVRFTQTQTGIVTGQAAYGDINTNGVSNVGYHFKRAPSFFDEVCYTGSSSTQTITHNLTVAPELIIVKKRTGGTARGWAVYPNDPLKRLILNSDVAASFDQSYWNDTAATSTVFTVASSDAVNGSGLTFVAYLFATCAGVSKVGSYTGTGTTLQVDCGFTGGARFVLIKRTDSTGDWYVWDSARGIVSGNDPYLLLNSTAAEVTNTDYIDTYSAGFELSSTAPAAINASGGTFIFLAIA